MPRAEHYLDGLCHDGDGAGRRIDLDLLWRPHRPGHGLDLSLRIGSTEAKMAPRDGGAKEDRFLRSDRAGSGFGHLWRTAHHRQAERRHLDPERTKEMDRQRTWGDLTIIWARDVGDDQVKGFVVENRSPGFHVEKIQHKM